MGSVAIAGWQSGGREAENPICAFRRNCANVCTCVLKRVFVYEQQRGRDSPRVAPACTEHMLINKYRTVSTITKFLSPLNSKSSSTRADRAETSLASMCACVCVCISRANFLRLEIFKIKARYALKCFHFLPVLFTHKGITQRYETFCNFNFEQRGTVQ